MTLSTLAPEVGTFPLHPTHMRLSLATRWLGALGLLLALSAPALAQRTVTLRMNSATLADTTSTDPALAGVQVRGQLDSGTALPDGGVIDWNSNTTLTPDNDGGDYWSIDFQIPDDDRLQFKFYFDQAEDPDGDGDGSDGIGGWEDGDNYVIDAGTGDVALDLHYFNKTGGSQPYDWRPFAAGGDSIAVWLRVYMNTVSGGEKGYEADDSALRVGARGNFGTLGAVDGEGPVVDWGDGGDTDEGVRLSRESDDATKPGFHLYSGIVKYPAASAGMEANYKFYFFDSDNTGDGGYEDGDNRTFTLPAAGADTTIHWVYYSNSPPLSGTLLTSQVTFSVDISPLTSIGLFTTGEDGVQVRGGFNGWDCPADNQDDCLLTQEPFSSTYSREFPVRSLPGTSQNYKYYLDFQPPFTDGAGNTLDIGWEEPLDYGGGNRPFTFEGSPTQDVGVQFFNGIREGNVIGDGESIALTFTVDMSQAVDFQVDAFDPAVDTVSVRFEDNVWLLTQGYAPGSEALIDVGDGQAIPGFVLSDDDGDLVYTGTLTVDGPTYNGIGYSYFYSNADRSGIVSEGAGGFDAGRRRYRYITDVSTSAFSFALDTFRSSSQATPWEVNPTSAIQPGDLPHSIANGEADNGGVVANEAGPGRDGALALGPVFPNPTTGVARVELALGEAADVALRVFDVTGREVARVFEGPVSGNRTVTLDTRGWAQGLYIVRAESAVGVATRRITVIR